MTVQELTDELKKYQPTDSVVIELGSRGQYFDTQKDEIRQDNDYEIAGYEGKIIDDENGDRYRKVLVLFSSVE